MDSHKIVFGCTIKYKVGYKLMKIKFLSHA
jgi:hypothetical protein